MSNKVNFKMLGPLLFLQKIKWLFKYIYTRFLDFMYQYDDLYKGTITIDSSYLS